MGGETHFLNHSMNRPCHDSCLDLILRHRPRNDLERLLKSEKGRVSVQEVESLGGHIATLCLEFDFYEVKKRYYFQKEKGSSRSRKCTKKSFKYKRVLYYRVCIFHIYI